MTAVQRESPWVPPSGRGVPRRGGGRTRPEVLPLPERGRPVRPALGGGISRRRRAGRGRREIEQLSD